MSDTLLAFDNVSCHFGSGASRVDALSGVTFDIKRGEIFGLVGESGSGKTTAGRIISGIYTPTLGEVRFNGKRIALGTDEAKREIKEIKEWGRVKKNAIFKNFLKNPKTFKVAIRERKYVNNDLQCRLRIPNSIIKESESLRRKRRGALSGIQMIFQDPSSALNPCMTALECVMEGLVIRGNIGKEEARRRALSMLFRVGLPENVAQRYPHELSGGQKQRLGIARAVLLNPELLVADEPISALDVSVGAQVINLLGELARDMSLSVLFIAHDLSVVRHICDRVGVMFHGHLVELAACEDIFEHPRHPYTKALLSSIPEPDPNSSRIRIPVPEPESIVGKLCEVAPGHLVLCSDEEYRRYKEEGREGKI